MRMRLATALLATTCWSGLALAEDGALAGAPVGKEAAELGAARSGPNVRITLNCGVASYDYTRCDAPANFVVERAEITRVRSSASCEGGRSWGWDNRGVWTDDGCRAEFALYGRDREDSATRLTCGSSSYNRVRCPTLERIETARLDRRLSSAPCVEGRSWGFEARAIWVDDGCRGEFIINDYGEAGPGPDYPGPGPGPDYPGPGPDYPGPDYPGPGYSGDPYMVSSDLWYERRFSGQEVAVAACARRIMQAAWEDADYSAQFERAPTVDLPAAGPSFDPGPGRRRWEYRVRGPVTVYARSGYQRWLASCTVSRGVVVDFEARPAVGR